LADTALKTADAGYLTRRLVDITQEIVVTEDDCKTINGIEVEAIKEGDEVIESLQERILGRTALEDIIHPMSGDLIVRANEEITEEKVEAIEDAEIERVKIRTVLTCESKRGVCRMCYGRNLATGKLVDIGEAVGIIAAQSIGEPGTQLTMRTFHIGGTAYRKVEEREIKLKYPVEIVELPKYLIKGEGYLIASRAGNLIIRKVLSEYPISSTSQLKVSDGLWVNVGDTLMEEDGRAIQAESSGMIKIKGNKLLIVARERSIPIKTGTHLWVKEGDVVPDGKIIAEFDPYNEPILTEKSGIVKCKDIIKGRTVREELDENTGLFGRIIIPYRGEELQPQVLIMNEQGETIEGYILPVGARLEVRDGQRVSAGDTLAKFPQEIIKTKDITGGLPRVAELFEARRPKESAIVTEIDGVVKFKGISGGMRKVEVKNETTGDCKEYLIPIGKHLKVHEGDRVLAGDRLTEGAVDAHDILRIKGDKKLQEYLVNEIQEVYRLQGVEINDKHIELVIRQMLRKIEVTEVGDTSFLIGEHVDKAVFQEENEKVVAKGGIPAKGKPTLLGITKASISTQSFISAASFQETTKVLTDAAVKGKIDELRGLKENVILGCLIPAGTGFLKHKHISS
jgi:DNA-directed RNA polymerase subunit beta'